MATSFVDLRWLAFLAGNLCLCYLAALANGVLGAHGCALYAGGLCLIYPALRTGPWAGWACVAVPALLVEAQLPVPYGLSLTVWTSVWLVLRLLRGQIRRDNPYQILFVAELANAACFWALAVCLRDPARGYWARAAIDFALSAAVLVLLTPWFLRFQDCLLRLFALDFELEDGEEK